MRILQQVCGLSLGRYMRKNLTTKLVVKYHMYMLTMAEGISLKIHVDEFGSILMDLKNMNIEYE